MQYGSVRAFYKRNAKARGHKFDLTLEEVTALVSQPCHYCGAGLSNLIKPRIDRDRFQAFAYNGIDRIDNSKGYVTGNVVTACKRCNYAKGKDLSYEMMVFIGQAIQIWEATSEEQRPELRALLRDLVESGRARPARRR